VSLSSNGGEGSNSNTSNTGSGHSSAVTGYPPQNNINDKVEIFESSNETHPDGEDLRKICDNDPSKIFEYSKALIKDVDVEKDTLLGEITSEQDKGNISEERALDLKEEVEGIAEYHKDEIQETNDTSVEYIDDSSDTEEFTFKHSKE
jgi:hypothetical protein